MNTDKIIHKRYISGTKSFEDRLIELGYEHFYTDKKGNLNEVKFFKLGEFGEKIIKSSYTELELSISLPNDDEVIQYKGNSVPEDILVFFTKREPKYIN